MTVTAKRADPHHAPCVLILNDMGAVMHVSYDVTSTLRSQAKHHEPIVQIGGCVRAFHQNGSGEVQMSEVGYTVSTNSNASGRNTPIVLVLNDQGGRNEHIL